MSRALRDAYWFFPIVFCFWLYWLGIRIWFQEDDFAWLQLNEQISGWRDLLHVLFAPMAQGTIRPLSERAFFMILSYLFGLHALPFRLIVFANQALDIALLAIITRKLTRSAVAGFLAAIFWISNTALITPMSWSAAYNEIQCAGFVLLSFYLFLRFTETGVRRYYVLQWLTFLIGFGALEVNVLYPAIAALYALLCARRYFRYTLPLFIPSALFTAVHRLVAPQTRSFYYETHYGGPMIATLVQYWRMLLSGEPERQTAVIAAVTVALTAGLLSFTFWHFRKRNWMPLFYLGWYLIFMLPFLPLSNHISFYYQTIPAIGIAMLAGDAVALASCGKWPLRTIAAVLAAAYLLGSIPQIRSGMYAAFARADRSRMLVQSVAYAERLHPGKTILLDRIDDELFWTAVYDSPFRALGFQNVYLTPEAAKSITPNVNIGPIEPYTLPPSPVRRLIRADRAVVYVPDGRNLKNITRIYAWNTASQPPPPLSSRVDLSTDYYDDQVGFGWYPAELGFRWMSPRAQLFLRGPSAQGQKLHIHGWTPPELLAKGPAILEVRIDGHAAPPRRLDSTNKEFDFAYDLPPGITGAGKVEIILSVCHGFRIASDNRDFALMFGDCSIH